MFKQRMAICAALVGAVSLTAMPAFAADDDHDSGFYLGAALGDFSADYHKPGDVTDRISPSTATTRNGFSPAGGSTRICRLSSTGRITAARRPRRTSSV